MRSGPQDTAPPLLPAGSPAVEGVLAVVGDEPDVRLAHAQGNLPAEKPATLTQISTLKWTRILSQVSAGQEARQALRS